MVKICSYIDGGMYGFDGGGMFHKFRLVERCIKCDKVNERNVEKKGY